VFKWVVSPLLAKAIGVPANLEGQFWVNCSFIDKESEALMQNELEE